VTFKLESVPSSTRDFEFTSDVSGSSSPFTLSDASPAQIYHYIVNGEYELTLPLAETTGYTAAVSCVGAASSTTNDVTTTFAVAGADVTCTITLTGMSTANVILLSLTHFRTPTQMNCRRFRATTSLRRPLPARAKAARRLQPLPAIRIPMRNRPRHVITTTVHCSVKATRLLRAKASTALVKRVSVLVHWFCLQIKLTIVQKVRRRARSL
jgi:hypothetical protein